MKLQKIFFVLSSVIIFITNVYGQVVNENLWVPNSTVFATFRSGNTIYIGGHFTVVGPSTGHGAAINKITGQVDLSFPKVNGHIYAVVSDGIGGWYIGGDFTRVRGKVRNNIAHIFEDGSLDENWNPDANEMIWALCYKNTTVYAGGSFTHIGGVARNYIVALDTVSGSAKNWNPGANNTVRTIAATDTRIYCGGLFTTIGGENRNYIASIDAATGIVTNWDPDAGNYVYDLAISGSLLYVGGGFSEIGGAVRRRIAALDTLSGAATDWDPNASSIVTALAVYGNNVYAGGWFTTIGGQSRNRIAAIDTSTGLATPWNPNSNGHINSLIIMDSNVYAGGSFTNINGVERMCIAELDIVTGSVTDWNPLADDEVLALASYSATIYAGGRFASIGGVKRKCIAALDATTGEATEWNPGINGDVGCITVSDSKVYVGGDFDNVGGAQRNFIAAIDAETGTVTNWNPGANNDVATITVTDSLVYVGGYFTYIGGSQRKHIAALDKNNGTATSWNPNPNGYVRSIEVFNSLIYVGGFFTKIGAQTTQPDRYYLASINRYNGYATDWNPSPNYYVWCMARSGSILYVGGEFTVVGGVQRSCIAAVDAITGNLLDWNPYASGGGPPITYVRVLEVVNPLVYAGGSFNWIGQEIRKSIAALDISTGKATNWNPNPITHWGDPPSEIYALDVYGSSVYLGGLFFEVVDKVQQIFAEVTADTVSGTTTQTLVSLNNGWNLLAVPLAASDMTGTTLFPTAISPFYGYNAGYNQVTTLENGKGYWVKFDGSQSVTITGNCVSGNEVSVVQGWNLIGPFAYEVIVPGITTVPPNILSSPFYGYDGGYTIPVTLLPGKGYWIKSNQTGVIQLNAGQ
jgi:hypothetical protein